MENYYPYIFDIGVILVLVVCIIYGYCKGLLSMLASIIGRILAVILALLLINPVSTYIYGTFIEEKVSDVVTEKISSIVTTEADATTVEMVTKVTEDMPKFIQKTALNLSESLTLDTEDSTKIAESINNNVISPIIISAVEVLVFIVLFTVFMIIVKCLTKVFEKVNDIPLVGKLNKVLGSFAGIINAAIIIIIAIYIIRGAVLLMGDSSDILNNEVIGQSKIFSVLYEQNFLEPIIKGENVETI